MRFVFFFLFVKLFFGKKEKKKEKKEVTENEEPEALCGSETVGNLIFVYFDIEYVTYDVAILIT